MNFYFAPMEGITGYIFRNTFDEFYDGIDKYFTPFIVANHTYKLQKKEKKDISPENNHVNYLVPQILGNDSNQILWLISELKKSGYKEINLNFGCPASTVVKKRKGSGILYDTDKMDNLLYNIFDRVDHDINISVKIRTGIKSSDNFENIISILNKYPLYELIVHPRTQKQQYSGEPDLSAFKTACDLSRAPVVYNGDITDITSYHKIADLFPEVSAVMIGRGLLKNPELISLIKSDGKKVKTGSSGKNNDVKVGAFGKNKDDKTGASDMNNYFKATVSGANNDVKTAAVGTNNNVKTAAASTSNYVKTLHDSINNDSSPHGTETSFDFKRLKNFLDVLLTRYIDDIGEKNSLFKMKELWCYLSEEFPENISAVKKIRKAASINEYRAACAVLFANTETNV